MKNKHKNYVAPLCEVIEVELEGAVLSDSTKGSSNSYGEGGSAW